MKHQTIFSNGLIEFELPSECVSDCSGMGDATEAVEHWQRELNLNLNREHMITELSEYGAWDDFDTATNETLEQRLIWLGACDINEELFD